MTRPPNSPLDSADRIFLIKAVGWMASAATVFAVLVGFYLRETRGIGAAAFLMLVLLSGLGGAGAGWLIWWVTGRASSGLVNLVMGAGNLTPAPSFSLQESLVARGRPQEAVDSFTLHLAEHPADHDARFALAEVLAGPLGNREEAARQLLAIRASDPSPAEEYRVSQALIDLYRAADNRGRLLAELARFADRYRGTPAGDSAKRALLELKQDAELGT